MLAERRLAGAARSADKQEREPRDGSPVATVADDLRFHDQPVLRPFTAARTDKHDAPLLLDAELIAFRIVHDDPMLVAPFVILDHRRAEVRQTLHFPGDGHAMFLVTLSLPDPRVDVEMDPVLQSLRLGDTLEVD